MRRCVIDGSEFYCILTNSNFPSYQAAAQGSEDAFERLTALMQPVAKPYERADHESVAVKGIERRRTLLQKRAQEEAAAAGEEVSDIVTAVSALRQNSEELSQQQQQQQRDQYSTPALQQLTPPDTFTLLPARDQQQQTVAHIPHRRPLIEQPSFPSQPQPGYGPSSISSRPSFETPYAQQSYLRPTTPSPPLITQQSYPARQSSLPITVDAPMPAPTAAPRQQRSLPPDKFDHDFGYAPFAPSHQLQQQAWQFTDRPRFTLIDDGPPPGAIVAVRSRRTPSQASNGSSLLPHQRGYSRDFAGRSQEGKYSGDYEAEDEPKPATKYATFAEMGIEGRKAEDKECVIM